MEQITVPQFIESEDKILGPITVRQFGILFTGGVLIFVAFKVFDFLVFIFVALLILILSGVLAFLKVNGRPVHFFLFNIVQTMRNPSVRVWKKDVTRSDITMIRTLHKERQKTTEAAKVAKGKYTATPKERVSEQRLSELALQVDTGGAYRPEDEEEGTELF
ncbi:PrgI family protein [Candidatus Uhrbacteria bacterium]|nr:PrgI family protein [Candidatus Uhrbacteria bacterium]